jgi:hypothetical protein
VLAITKGDSDGIEAGIELLNVGFPPHVASPPGLPNVVGLGVGGQVLRTTCVFDAKLD